MVVNDDAGSLDDGGAWATIATVRRLDKLAPTEGPGARLILIYCRSEFTRDGRQR